MWKQGRALAGQEYIATFNATLDRAATKVEAGVTVGNTSNLTAHSFHKVLAKLRPAPNTQVLDIECGMGMRTIQAAVMWAPGRIPIGWDQHTCNIKRARALAQTTHNSLQRLEPRDTLILPPPFQAENKPRQPVFLHREAKHLRRMRCLGLEQGVVIAFWERWTQKAMSKLGRLFGMVNASCLIAIQCRTQQPACLLEGLDFPKTLRLKAEVAVRVRGGAKQRMLAYLFLTDDATHELLV